MTLRYRLLHDSDVTMSVVRGAERSSTTDSVQSFDAAIREMAVRVFPRPISYILFKYVNILVEWSMNLHRQECHRDRGVGS